MTETEKYMRIIASSNERLKVPTKEEFNKYACNELTDADFNTTYPTGYQADKVANAIRWTLNNEKKRNMNYYY